MKQTIDQNGELLKICERIQRAYRTGYLPSMDMIENGVLPKLLNEAIFNSNKRGE
jgi:hypothetical protein